MLTRARTFPLDRDSASGTSLAMVKSQLQSISLGTTRDDGRLKSDSLAISTNNPITLADEALKEWNAEVRKLTTPEEREDFFNEVKHVKSFSSYVQIIEKDIQDSNKSSKTLKVAKWIKPVFKTLNMIAPTAINYAPVDPRISGIVLGAITNVLSISSRYVDYQEGIEGMISDMASKLDFVGQYGDSIFPKDLELRKALIRVYSVILKFCVDASRLFINEKGKKRAAILRVGKSSWETFQSKFGDVRAEFGRRLEDFRFAVGTCRDRAITQLGRNQEIFIEFVVQATSSLEQKMEESRQREEMQSLKERMASRNLTAVDQLTGEKRNRLLNRLPWNSFREVQEERFPVLIEGTGQWLSDLDAFRKWRTRPESSLLWVHGKHGSGKSHVACQVIEDLRISCELARGAANNEKDLIAIAYVYCSSMTDGDNDPKRLLGSVFKQLLEQLPATADVPSLYKNIGEKNETPTIGDIKDGIQILAAWFSQTFLVFDGLDECSRSDQTKQTRTDNEAFRKMCEFVALLSKNPSSNLSIKTLVFSRPKYPQIEDAFAGCIEVQADNGANESDIKEYISTMTENLTNNQRILLEIKDKLLSGSEGMFLWVKLFINVLREECETARDMQDAMLELPQSLGEVYHRSLDRVMRQAPRIKNRALKAIMWITNAKRSLSWTELRQILVIRNDMTDWDEACQPERGGDLITQCGDLIVLVNDQYSLIHLSLKEYLTDTLSTVGSLKDYQDLQLQQAGIMAETCLVFLNFETFRHGPIDTQEELNALMEALPFLEYSSSYWGDHLREVDKSLCGKLDLLAQQLLFCDNARELCHLVARQGPNIPILSLFPCRSTPLHLLAMFNLVHLAETLSNITDQLNQVDDLGHMAIDWALYRECHDMTIWLLHKHEDEQYSTSCAEPRLPRLCFAVERSWTDAIKLLVQLGEDVQGHYNGNTPLHYAKTAEVVDVLLSLGADINATDVDGATPLYSAAVKGYSEVALKLIAVNADVTIPSAGNDDKDITALHCAADNGDIILAKALLQKGANVNAITARNASPIFYAVRNNHVNMVQLLLEHGADCNGTGQDGWNSLLIASFIGSEECLELLLDADASVTALDAMKRNAIHLAAEKEHMGCIRVLKERGTPMDQVDTNGLTPLYDAITDGRLETAKTLIQKFNCNPNYPGFTGRNALHCAAFKVKDQEAPQFLAFLLDFGVDPRSKMSENSSALHIAANYDNAIFADSLLHIAPDLARAVNDSGQTPMHGAAKNGSYNVLDLLIRYDISLRDSKDNQFDTPLHLAAAQGQLECVKRLAVTENINSLGFCSMTPLLYACSAGNFSVVEWLLEKGGMVNARNTTGCTPLIQSLLGNHVAVANLLLDHHADPKVVDNTGITPLYAAILAGDEKLARRIVELDCDHLILCRVNSGYTPFSMAVLKGFSALVRLFLEKGQDGTSIVDNEGRSCIQFAAAKGHLSILNHLVNLHPESIFTVDDWRQDALEYAAGTGNNNTLSRLIELGVTANGLQRGIHSPLHQAVKGGCFSTVDLLLRAGADVKLITTLPWRTSTLHLARRYPRIAERLLEAGANPFVRDFANSTALENADPHVRQNMVLFGQSALFEYGVDRTGDKSTVDNIVCDILAWILEPPEPFLGMENSISCYRVECVEALIQILRRLKTPASVLELRMFYTELCAFSLSEEGHLWECNGCTVEIKSERRYQCLECSNVTLCGSCYAAYVAVDGSTNPIKGLQILQELETRVYAIRYIGQFLRHSKSIFILAILRLKRDESCWEIIVSMLRAYEDWESTYNRSKRFDVNTIPGRCFLKIVEMASELDEDMEQQETFGPYSRIAKALSEFYNKHKADKELAYCLCDGHNYLEVPMITELPEHERDNFDAKGRLTEAYLRHTWKMHGRVVRSMNQVDQVQKVDPDPTPAPAGCETITEPSLNVSDLSLSKSSDGFNEDDPAPRTISTSIPSPRVDIHMPRLHFIEGEGQYFNRLIRNFNQFETNRRASLRNLETVYQSSPAVAVLMGRKPMAPKEMSNITMENVPDGPFNMAMAIEMCWQFVQVLLVGFVSSSLTEQLIAREVAKAQKSVTEVFRAAGSDSSLRIANTSATPGTTSALVEDEFLGRLPANIRNELSLFVTRARQLRDNPEHHNLSSRNIEEDSAALVSPADVKYIMESSPFVVYDFYNNPVLPRLISQRK